MKNKKDITDFSENSHPILNGIEKKNEFSTPNNYFEVLPEITNSKLLVKNKLNFIFDILSYKVLVPTFTILLLTILYFNWNNNTAQIELTNEQLSELIIETDFIEFDDEIVFETYAETIILKEIETEGTDEYLDYLTENDIDLNTIIEEL